MKPENFTVRNCRPKTLLYRFMHYMGIELTCDHRCWNSITPCQYSREEQKTLWTFLEKIYRNEISGCGKDCRQGRKCDCDTKKTK